MGSRRASWLAGAVLVLGLALTIAAGVLHYLTRDIPIEFFGIRGFQGVLGLVIAGIGYLIVSRRARNPIGWIFVVTGSISCLQAFDSAYGTYSIARHAGTLPFTEVLTWLAVWIWVPIVGPLLTYVPILFPDGRVENGRQRYIAIFATASMIGFAAAFALSPGQAGELPIGVENPYALSAAAARRLTPLMGLFLPAVVLSVGVLVGRFRRSTGELRQQMKLITYAGAIATAAIIASTVPEILGISSESIVGRATAIALILGLGAMPVAAGIAVLRYGLYEIDLVISRTIVYGMLAAFITVVYVAVVIGVGAVVGAGANTALSLAATAIVAMAIQPVRARATHLANRLVFGRRATPYEALSEFSARLSERSDDTLPQLARLITEATAADRASVWLAVGPELRPAAVWPTSLSVGATRIGSGAIGIPGWSRVFPVQHEGELLGAVAVSFPEDDPPKAPEERLLVDLSSQAGLLLRNVKLIEELRASRQRLVAAQDTERRRIERDLHDGAQQQLVALAVKLSLLERVLGTVPAQAGDLFREVKTEATDALENLRNLARGIYPKLLTERGLVAALQAQAVKSPVPASVSAEGVGRYPQDVESAVYFCALEALQNVAKYSRATVAEVRIREEEGRLTFVVRDDGVGFDAAGVARGSGLTNMTDRIEALGGRLRISSTPNAGTTVEGWIPATT